MVEDIRALRWDVTMEQRKSMARRVEKVEELG